MGYYGERYWNKYMHFIMACGLVLVLNVEL